MASFSMRELYGGAITSSLPASFIDSSTLREIPDHQEVYLSSKTLTSLIFEINQYVQPVTASQTRVDPAITVAETEEAAAPAAISIADKAAALYHLRDLVDPNDTLTTVSTPKGVEMQNPSLQGLPALIVRGKLISTEKESRVLSVLPEGHQHAPGVVRTSTTIRLLLVRIKEKGTDLCVAVNVPWKEFETPAQVDEEEVFADSVLEHFISSLEIKDFGLFEE